MVVGNNKNMADEYRNRPSESTSSNDSGVIMEDIQKLQTDSAYLTKTKDNHHHHHHHHQKQDTDTKPSDNQQNAEETFNKFIDKEVKLNDNCYDGDNDDDVLNIKSNHINRSYSTSSSNNQSISSNEPNNNNHDNNNNNNDVDDNYNDDDDDDDKNSSVVYDSDYMDDFVKEPDTKFNQNHNNNVDNFKSALQFTGRNENIFGNGESIIDRISVENGKSLAVPSMAGSVNVNGLNFSGNNRDVTLGTKIVCNEFVFVSNDSKNGYPNDLFKLNNGNENFGYDDESSSVKKHPNGTTRPDFKIDKPKKFTCDLKTITIAVTSIIVVIFCVITITTIIILNKQSSTVHKTGDGDDSRKNIPINSTIGADIISPGSVFRFISRDEWLAQPPNDVLNDLELPSTRVVIAHTATEGCTNQGQCTFRTRFIQTFHMDSRGYDDIAYNFLVGGDGAIYEGRGWDKEGAHSKGFNKKTICIAFIGTFIKIIPTDGQLNAAKLLIAEGVRLGKLTKDYQLYGHRQFIPSESPGDALYNIIKTWPNFSTVVSQE